MMLRAGDDRQLMARVAALAAPTIAVTLLATMPLLGYTSEQVGAWAAVVVPGVLGASLAAWFLPWRRWHDRALLAVPLGAWAGLAVLGLASHGRAAPYAGYSALLFLYIGLTQRPWTSLFLLPVALAVHVVMWGGLSAELAARLPISITVWVATAEVVARYRVQTGEAFAGLERRAHVDPLTGVGNRYDLSRMLAALRPGDAVAPARPRPLQAAERHGRARCRGRRAPRGGRAAAPGRPAGGHRHQVRRRGVPGAAPGRRRCRRHQLRRPPAGSLGRRPAGRDLLDRHRRASTPRRPAARRRSHTPTKLCTPPRQPVAPGPPRGGPTWPDRRSSRLRRLSPPCRG